MNKRKKPIIFKVIAAINAFLLPILLEIQTYKGAKRNPTRYIIINGIAVSPISLPKLSSTKKLSPYKKHAPPTAQQKPAITIAIPFFLAFKKFFHFFNSLRQYTSSIYVYFRVIDPFDI